MMANTRWPFAWLLVVTCAAAACSAGCMEDKNGCAEGLCHGWGGSGGSGAQGGGGAGGTGGGGGSDPCGSCQPPTPLCDPQTQSCVACLDHGDCTDPAAARCEAGSCVPCQGSTECADLLPGEVCDSGACVECAIGEVDACTASQTCDLLQNECVDVTAGSVANCKACTNDGQCADGRCIPMQFESSAHGHYCLAEPSPTCDRPFQVPLNRSSLNGAVATNYCGIEEDLATCEAVLALLQGWYCTGTDGMCSELQAGTEVAGPGAICEQVGVGGDQCTYACGIASQCPSSAPANTCGTGAGTPPGWCGG